MKTLQNSTQQKNSQELVTAHKFSPSLTVSELEVVKASKGDKIRTLDAGIDNLNFKATLMKAITGALINLKTSIDGDRALFEHQVRKALLLSFGNLTLKEIELAIFKGSLGDFKAKPDEVVFISPKTVCDWIRAYIEQVKKEAMSKQVTYEQSLEKKEPTPEEQEDIIQKWVQREIVDKFNEGKKQGKVIIEDHANVIYRHLTKRGIWNPSDELKTKAYQDAKAKFIATHDKSSLPRDEWFDWADFKQIEFDTKPKAEKERNTIFLKVVSRAKDTMLQNLLKELLEMDMDIEEFLKGQAE